MKWLKTISGDSFLWIGWIAIALSAIVFCIPPLATTSPDHYLAYFFFHFAVTIAYHFFLYLNKAGLLKEQKIYHRLVKLVLLLISAYALNREMEVFATSPGWFSILLIVLSLNYLLSVAFMQIPVAARHLSFSLYGVGFVVFCYLAFYLLPLYAVSIPGLLLFGVSLHTFVPLLFCIATVRLVRQLAQGTPRYWLSFMGGITAVIIVSAVFIIRWDNKLYDINRLYVKSMAEGDSKLPSWIQVAQQTTRDGITEAVLKTNLVYKIPDWNDNAFWGVPNRSFGDRQQVHDPLVTLASLFAGQLLLPEAERIKILESQYNARHQALERLWTGENLRTAQVTTNVKVWPATHLAYTEKMLTVFNHQSTKSWNRQEEGIYTFHLPEGAVVTSLSLWINGKEEKAILTSKGKAATAYRTIVGYERRDPSVVHWQEGNTVSVRVFPVLAGSSRTFKIGVTAPLRKEASRLIYDNIWFDGPDAHSADENVKLEIADDSKTFIQQAALKADNEKVVTREGAYQPTWSVSFKDEGLRPHSFSFNGYRYSLQPYNRKRIPVTISDVYLDINDAWSASDFETIWQSVQHKKVWVYNGEMQAVTKQNKYEQFALLRKQSFSLFPFHLLPNPDIAIVVGKSGSYSPNIADLEGSHFLNNLTNKLSSTNRVRLFQLGSELSPYLRSLKERRYFDYENGNEELLGFLLRQSVFTKDFETDDAVIIHEANLMITKQPGEGPSNAPDHLMRLFAYNHILQQLGGANKGTTDSTLLVTEAEAAYVVSPVSSLLVLETQNDYDRFDIKDSKNSLKNASFTNKGAVPEPGEWAIIILGGAALLVFVYKTKMA